MEISILFPADQTHGKDSDCTLIHPFSPYNSNTFKGREVWSIVAAGTDFSIGRNGEIPWRLSEDLRHFRQITMGHPVIMGRKTWESLPKRPLPGRRNIVLTRDSSYAPEGAETATSVESAIALCDPTEIPVIIGGGQVYSDSIGYCSKVYLTAVDMTVPDADTFFPPLSVSEWSLMEDSDIQESSDGIRYRFLVFSRK